MRRGWGAENYKSSNQNYRGLPTAKIMPTLARGDLVLTTPHSDYREHRSLQFAYWCIKLDGLSVIIVAMSSLDHQHSQHSHPSLIFPLFTR